MTQDLSELGFEEALNALEEHVRKIESGDIPLEEALALYEQGVLLAQRCHEQLDEAEQRVQQVTRGSSGIEEVPLPDVDE